MTSRGYDFAAAVSEKSRIILPYPSTRPPNGWKEIEADCPSKSVTFMLTLCLNAICNLLCITVLFTTLKYSYLYNLVKKSLQVRIPELFWLSSFCLFLPKNSHFWSVGKDPNTYPDSPHSQGGMKFATQIAPLLNFKVASNLSLPLSWTLTGN